MEKNDDYRHIEQLEMVEPIIKIEGTIFEVLIKAHGLTHVKDNIYKSAFGRRYHLTKFGLEPAVVFNAHEEARKIQHELERVSEQLVRANKKIVNQTEETRKIQHELERISDLLVKANKKIVNQTETLRRLNEEKS